MINNNDIMKKLRVALQLKDTDIIAILKLADFETSPSELSAIFRKEDHPQFMPCGDQILRRFLDGLIIRNRGVREQRPDVAAPARGGFKKHRLVSQASSRTLPGQDSIRVFRADGV